MELNQRSAAGLSDNGPRFPLFDTLTELRLIQRQLRWGGSTKGCCCHQGCHYCVTMEKMCPKFCFNKGTQVGKLSTESPQLCVIVALLHSLSDKFHASPASNNHYVLMQKLLHCQLDNKSATSVVEHARRSLVPCVVIFH